MPDSTVQRIIANCDRFMTNLNHGAAKKSLNIAYLAGCDLDLARALSTLIKFSFSGNSVLP